MLSDVLTKDMPADHLREALARGTWRIESREEMVKTARRVARERWEARMRDLVNFRLRADSLRARWLPEGNSDGALAQPTHVTSTACWPSRRTSRSQIRCRQSQ